MSGHGRGESSRGTSSNRLELPDEQDTAGGKIWDYRDPDVMTLTANARASPQLHRESIARPTAAGPVFAASTESRLQLQDDDSIASPGRPDSRASDRRRNPLSRNGSRQNIPQSQRDQHPYQSSQRRNLSTDSIDSDALLDHRFVSQSLPRASFMQPRASVSNKGSHSQRRRSSKPTRGGGTGGRPRKSTLSKTREENSDDSSGLDTDDGVAGDERTSLLPHRRPRKSSSQLFDLQNSARRQSRREGKNAAGSGASSSSSEPGSPRSMRNPNFPPSIPSSFGSRRGSRLDGADLGLARQQAVAPISESMTGKDAAGETLRVNMAKRVMQYARKDSSRGTPSGNNPGSQDGTVDLAALPAVVATSPPREFLSSPDRDATLLTDEEDEDGTDNLGRTRLQSKAEADVCFPTAADYKEQGHIDFDMLQEWAREQIEQKEGGRDSIVEWRHRKLSEPMLVNGKYRNRGGWSAYKDRPEGGDLPSGEDNRPFRFTFFTDQLPSTIHSPTLYELPQEDESFQELFSSGNTWWLDVNSPSETEMKILSEAFGIHPLTTEDISMEEQREKVELFRHYYLVSFRSFQQDPESDDYLEPVNMYIIVFRSGIMTFHFGQTPHPANVRRRIRQLKDFISVSADWISYALIDDIVDAFSPLIHRIEYEVDTIDENVLGIDIEQASSHHGGGRDDLSLPGEKDHRPASIKAGSTTTMANRTNDDDEQANMLRRIGSCRKKVMGLLRLLGSKADVIKGFAKRCNEQWDVAPRSEIGLYLGDIQDHIVTMVQNLNHYEKILSRTHSNYLAQISIAMTRVNNDTNDVLSRLTVLGTMLIPMNLVTGLWGMNVPVPGQESEGLHWFFSILGCMAVFFVLIYFLGRRSGVV
ncbi:CorA metal ion transporter [Savitreella phatthalungensis]